MKKTISLIGMSAITIVILSIGSCGKSSREDARQSAKDNAAAESAFDDIFRQVDNSYNKANNEKRSELSGCASVTLEPIDTVTYPKTLTIDFGVGCEDALGITRSGKIIALIQNKYRNAGSITTVSLENYKRNGKAITGTKTITNLGPNALGHPVFGIEVTNASIETEDGKVSWTSSRSREWTEGYTTKWTNILDDVYQISGSANGTNAKGNTFKVNITSPLEVELSCKHITKGTIEITPESSRKRTIDYGDGTCDDKATIKIGTKTYDITLP